MKLMGFAIISIVLFISLFKICGAELDRGILTLSAMILLMSLFSDLKEFNFWGLWGKKDDKAKELKELEGKDGIDETSVPSPQEEQVQDAEKKSEIQLMDNNRGNFLVLAFEIERLLRIASSIIFGSADQKSLVNSNKLKERGFLTENGFKQVESVRWLRNMLVHGRNDEVVEDTITAGVAVAWSLYNEINNWLKTAHEDRGEDKP